MCGPGPATARKTLLVVAHSDMLSRLLGECLDGEGCYRVFTAPSLSMALSCARWRAPDLLVYAAEAAESSEQAFSRVRCHAPFAAMPMIVVGGDASAQVEAWPLTAFLEFPFRGGRLAKCVAELLAYLDIRGWAGVAS